jgi:hypothetical protein
MADPIAHFSPVPGLIVNRAVDSVTISGNMELCGDEASAVRAIRIQQMSPNREQRLLHFARFYSKRVEVQAGLAPERLADFRLSIDGQYQCPRCWIYDGREAALAQVPSNLPGHETFRCERCDRRLVFPVSMDLEEGCLTPPSSST